jgi:hypothetical protein
VSSNVATRSPEGSNESSLPSTESNRTASFGQVTTVVFGLQPSLLLADGMAFAASATNCLNL